MAQYSGYVGFGGPQYAPQPGQFGYAAPQQSAFQPASFGGQPQQFAAGQQFGAGQQFASGQQFGGAQPQFQQGFGGAAPSGGAFFGGAPSQSGFIGAGFGQRIAAPAAIQAQYRGKPAFFDANRGIFFDGKTAFYYAPQASASQQFSQAQFGQGQFAPAAQQSVFTAVEGPRFVLGNGTQGNLREHANALASVYVLEQAPQYYL